MEAIYKAIHVFAFDRSNWLRFKSGDRTWKKYELSESELSQLIYNECAFLFD